MPNLLEARGASITIKDPKQVPGMNANLETFRFQIIDSLRKHERPKVKNEKDNLMMPLSQLA